MYGRVANKKFDLISLEAVVLKTAKMQLSGARTFSGVFEPRGRPVKGGDHSSLLMSSTSKTI